MNYKSYKQSSSNACFYFASVMKIYSSFQESNKGILPWIHDIASCTRVSVKEFVYISNSRVCKIYALDLLMNTEH